MSFPLSQTQSDCATDVFTNLYSLLQVSTAVVSDSAWAEERGVFLHIQSLLLPDTENIWLRQGGDTVGLTCLPSAPPTMGTTHTQNTHTHTHTRPACSGTSMGLSQSKENSLRDAWTQKSKPSSHYSRWGFRPSFLSPISYLYHSYLELSICLPLISLCLPNMTNNSVPLCFSS